MLIRWQILISHLFFEGRTNVNKPSEIKKPLIKHWFYDINIFAQAAIKRLYTYIILWFKCYLLAKNIYYTAGHFWSIWVEKRWKFIDVFYGWSLLHTDPLWQIWRNNCFDGKACNFESNLSGLNSLDLKKTKKIIKGQIFFQRPNMKAKGQKIWILWFFQWFGLVCKQLFRKSHWFK